MRDGCAAIPGFTAVSVFTLALGIGASTAIFSAVNPILFEPLPYPQADRIVTISDIGADGTPLDVTFGTYRELRRSAADRSTRSPRSKPWQPTMIGTGRAGAARRAARERELLPRARRARRRSAATSSRPTIASTDRDVVILSDALWRRRFGADPAIVGQQITLDG